MVTAVKLELDLVESMYLHGTLLQKIRKLLHQNGGIETSMVTVHRSIANKLATQFEE